MGHRQSLLWKLNEKPPTLKGLGSPSSANCVPSRTSTWPLCKRRGQGRSGENPHATLVARPAGEWRRRVCWRLTTCARVPWSIRGRVEVAQGCVPWESFLPLRAISCVVTQGMCLRGRRPERKKPLESKTDHRGTREDMTDENQRATVQKQTVRSGPKLVVIIGHRILNALLSYDHHPTSKVFSCLQRRPVSLLFRLLSSS